MRPSLPGALRKLAFAAILPLAAHAAIPTNVTTRNYFGTLTFNRAVAVAAVPGMDSTFVVLEQWANGSTTTGQALLVRPVAGTWTKSTFDTVTFTGTVTSNREMGLLGIAFHPSFAQNRKYYLAYTPSYTGSGAAPGRLHVVERRADLTMLQRDASIPSRVLLNLTQSGNVQKGGHLAFGPVDGHLYVGLGDGGGSGDPLNLAQNADSLQGKILRINVNAADAGKEYAVPADNPFVGQAAKKGEVYALGVRNPWRFTIHPTRNELWVGDVGRDLQDEVTLAPKGGNLGWKLREGASCFADSVSGCTTTGLVEPLYTRSAQALIGGVFFLGEASGQFHDTYIFGNSSNGFLYAMRITGGAIADQPVQIGTATNVSSFGTDNRGRILAARVGNSSTGPNVTANTGTVVVLESPDMVLSPPSSLRHAARGARGRAVSWNEVAREPHLYEIRALDGRRLSAIPSGAFLAARKGGAEPARILSRVWE